MKALFILGMLLCAGLAQARHRDEELLGPKVSRAVYWCMKKHDCLGDGWRSVCAKNQDGAVGAFPNYCFLRCANKEEGVHWEPLYSYRTSRHCIRNWQRDPACSTCSEEREQHHH